MYEIRALYETLLDARHILLRRLAGSLMNSWQDLQSDDTGFHLEKAVFSGEYRLGAMDHNGLGCDTRLVGQYGGPAAKRQQRSRTGALRIDDQPFAFREHLPTLLQAVADSGPKYRDTAELSQDRA